MKKPNILYAREEYEYESQRVKIVEILIKPESIGANLYGSEFYRLNNGWIIRKSYFDDHAKAIEAEQMELFKQGGGNHDNKTK